MRPLARAAGAGAGLALLAACAPHRVEGWVTTPDRAQLLAPVRDARVSAAQADSGDGTLITVDASQRFQSMAGVGAAFTDASVELLQQRLSPDARAALLRELFGTGPTDAGFSLVRLPIGASDFSRTFYTLDDAPAGTRDDSLARFTLAPLAGNTLPLLRESRGIAPQLMIIATPWSAPAWMKTSAALAGGTLRDDAFDAYARYLDRMLRALDSAGTPVALLTVQNEPHHEPKDYPGMRLDPAQRARLVGRYLGPLLAQRRATTRLLDWDHNWDEPASPLAVLQDSAARRYVSGVAWHCYAGEVAAQSQVHDAAPGMETWFTECAGGDWAPNFGDNLRWNVRTLVIGAMRHWARGVVLWNLALDEHHGPHTGGCGNCRGVLTIDSASGRVTRNEEYYALAHVGRAVRTGAVRIGSTSGVNGIETVAFVNPDGSRVLIAVGSPDHAQPLRIRDGRRTIQATLPSGGVLTLRWR